MVLFADLSNKRTLSRRRTPTMVLLVQEEVLFAAATCRSAVLLVLKHTVFFHSKNPKKRKNKNRSSCPRKEPLFSVVSNEPQEPLFSAVSETNHCCVVSWFFCCDLLRKSLFKEQKTLFILKDTTLFFCCAYSLLIKLWRTRPCFRANLNKLAVVYENTRKDTKVWGKSSNLERIKLLFVFLFLVLFFFKQTKCYFY